MSIISFYRSDGTLLKKISFNNKLKVQEVNFNFAEDWVETIFYSSKERIMFRVCYHDSEIIKVIFYREDGLTMFCETHYNSQNIKTKEIVKNKDRVRESFYCDYGVTETKVRYYSLGHDFRWSHGQFVRQKYLTNET